MTTEKSETIRLQMMKENCNPESGNCDGFCHLCKKAIESAIELLNENKIIYYEIIEDVEGGFGYGGYETIEIAKEFLPKDKPAHIEKVTEIREVVKEGKQGEQPKNVYYAKISKNQLCELAFGEEGEQTE